MREVWGKALSLTTIVVTGASREEALQKNEQVCAALGTLQEQRIFESFSSIAPLFPSEQTRAANLPRLAEVSGRRNAGSELRHSLAARRGEAGFSRRSV